MASISAQEKLIRNWSAHLGMRLRRRGGRYSLYATYDDHDVGFATGDCLVRDLRTIRRAERWLGKYMDSMIARLGAA